MKNVKDLEIYLRKIIPDFTKFTIDKDNLREAYCETTKGKIIINIFDFSLFDKLANGDDDELIRLLGNHCLAQIGELIRK